MNVKNVATVFRQDGRARVYVLRGSKWIWVMTYDHRTGEVKKYIPRESIDD